MLTRSVRDSIATPESLERSTRIKPWRKCTRRARGQLPDSPCPSEYDFYSSYEWCLAPAPRVADVLAHLREQVECRADPLADWQLHERSLNVYLLSCALLNAFDDFIEGAQYRLPTVLRRSPLAPVLGHIVKRAESARFWLRWFKRVHRIEQNKRAWQQHIDTFLRWFVEVDCGKGDINGFFDAAAKLVQASGLYIPSELACRTINIPSAFRKQDLTHHDVLSLARRLADLAAAKQRPIIVVGLRTAGSYFAPLLKACLQVEGLAPVKAVTMRPGVWIAPHVRRELAQCAAADYLAVIIDDPPYTGGTIAQALGHLRRSGFLPGQSAILVPVRPVGQEWDTKDSALALRSETVITIAPEEWHKSRFLRSSGVEAQLRRYFAHRGYTGVELRCSAIADTANQQAVQEARSNERYRLKRVFTVELEDAATGAREIRHVLVKSAGWGFFGYSAFLVARQLADFVPPLLGLRDGFLYMEWLPQRHPGSRPIRADQIRTIATYVATRASRLRLDPARVSGDVGGPHRSGLRSLSEFLSKAYGSRVAAKLMEGDLRRELEQSKPPLPALIDGRMGPAEWLPCASKWKKIDFEHHGFGKHEVNFTDPAYDLADALLHFGMTADDEQTLIQNYVEATDDQQVAQRLTLAKLMTGCWSLGEARENLLKHPHRSREWARQYFEASGFLTRELARFCGSFVPPPADSGWHGPLIALDVDGVLDRRRFDVPTTTLSGIEALRSLHAHGFTIVLDSARSAREIADYCAAYHLAGGVAEYGSYIFDAVKGRGEVLVSGSALRQLETLRAALSDIPGVFLNDAYTHSIRASVFEQGRPVPLPFQMVPDLISRLQLNRLRCIQTSVDSTVIAKEVDKGRGLKSLLRLAGTPELEITAVGDSEPDLPLFAISKQSFSPAHIGCGQIAALVGAQIARAPYQRGLLEIVTGLTRGLPRRADYSAGPIQASLHDQTLLRMLAVSDRRWPVLLLQALLNPRTFRAFRT